MIVHYNSNKLRKILTDQRMLRRCYGRDCTNIMSRMTELRAVRDLSLISSSPPPIRHKLVGEYKGCWAVAYSPNDRIVFEPVNCNKIDDLSEIKEIRILALGDYH